jgi:hypothetical protein
MAHFSLLITHGAGRSSQWHNPFVIFSSPHEENFSAISIRTYLQCCQGTEISAAEHKRDLIKICVFEKLKTQYAKKGLTFQKIILCIFWERADFLKKILIRGWQHCTAGINKSFPQPL